MKRVILSLLLAMVAIPVSAQYNANTVLAMHPSGEAASTSLGALTPDQQVRASIFPIVSLYRWPSWGPTQEFTSWSVIYTRNDDWDPDSCAYPSAMQSPVPWNGGPTCGGGLFAWNISQFMTAAAARAFYDGLAAQQKQTAILYRIPGPVHSFNRDFVVFWQSFGSACSATDIPPPG